MGLSQNDFICLFFKKYEVPTTQTIEIKKAELESGKGRIAIYINISKTLKTILKE